MTKKTVNIGGQEITLRTSAYLPILFRMLFHEDFLRGMSNLNNARIRTAKAMADNKQRTSANAELTEENAQVENATQAEEKEVADAQNIPDDAEDGNLLEFIYGIDLVFMARMIYAMAYHADSSILDMEEWFSGLDDPNAVYTLTSAALEIYAEDAETTAAAKKKPPKRKEK